MGESRQAGDGVGGSPGLPTIAGTLDEAGGTQVRLPLLLKRMWGAARG